MGSLVKLNGGPRILHAGNTMKTLPSDFESLVSVLRLRGFHSVRNTIGRTGRRFGRMARVVNGEVRCFVEITCRADGHAHASFQPVQCSAATLF